MIIIYIIAVVIIVWSVWGYFGSRVEQTDYTVVKKTKNYEVRRYPEHLVAQTTVPGLYQVALNKGFRIIAGYIFGDNVKKEKIAMTAPVTEQKLASEKIAMTAPVLATTDGDSHIISFGMPRTYTAESLPIPNDPRVKIVSVPAKTYAVLRFTGWRIDVKTEKMKDKLLSALRHDSISVNGTPIYAGYNAPWTPPWMTRNEVMVELK
ncbi:MAG: heme-binding protein [Candidatus Falkowbacteria bacterium]